MVKDYGTVEAAAEADDVLASVTGRHIRPDPLRFAALAQFCVLTFGTAGSLGAHSVIFKEYMKYFELSIHELDFLNTLFLGSYLVIGGIIMRIFTKYGLKGGMRAGSAMFFVACVLRLVSVHLRDWFWIQVVAQFLAAFAINFVMAGPSLLSATWFPANERTVATTVASQADNLGIAWTLAYPSLFVQDGRDTHGMYIVFGTLFAAACLDSILTFFVVPDRPRIVEALSHQVTELEEKREERENKLSVHELSSSSMVSMGEAKAAAKEEETVSHLGLGAMFGQVIDCVPYVLLSVAAGLGVAVYWTYSVVYAQILAPFGVDAQESGILGAVKILFSIIPATFVAHRIDSTRSYKTPLMITLSMCVVCFLALVLVFDANTPFTKLLVYIIHLPMGVAQSLIMPVSLEYMVEITYPVDPSVSAGVFMYMLRIMCTVIVAMAPWLLPAHATVDQALRMMWIYVWLSVGAVVALCFVSSPLKRLDREKQLANKDTGSSFVLQF